MVKDSVSAPEAPLEFSPDALDGEPGLRIMVGIDIETDFVASPQVKLGGAEREIQIEKRVVVGNL